MMKLENSLFLSIVEMIQFKSMKFVTKILEESEEDLWKEKFKLIQSQENIIKKKTLFLDRQYFQLVSSSCQLKQMNILKNTWKITLRFSLKLRLIHFCKKLNQAQRIIQLFKIMLLILLKFQIKITMDLQIIKNFLAN